MNRAGVPVDAFAGRFHFGTEFFIYVREFAEREYWNFDGVPFSNWLDIEAFHLSVALHKLNFRRFRLLIYFNLNFIIRKLVNQ